MPNLAILLIKLNDQLKAAFASATDVVKGTLSLSTALLALSVTFMKDLNQHPTVAAVWTLEFSWCMLSVSAFLGVVTLMAITGTLANTKTLTGEALYARNIRWPMTAHFLCFFAGVATTAAFGMLSV